MPLPFCATVRARLLGWLESCYLHWTRLPQASPTLDFALDLTRPKSELLLLENALLRQQLVILQRQVQKTRLNRPDRFKVLLLTSRLKTWKELLLILTPVTLRRWHRLGFRLIWRLKTRAPRGRPRLLPETIALLQQMAAENPLRAPNASAANAVCNELLETRNPPRQEYHSNLPSARAATPFSFSRLEYLFEKSCQRRLGV